jgi:hypothetical protein
MVLGFALLRYAMSRLRGPAASQSEKPEAAGAIPAQLPRADPPHVALNVPEKTPPAVPARRHRTRLGPPSELRRAVVLMTVLGPCRALLEEEAARTSAPDERPYR